MLYISFQWVSGLPSQQVSYGSFDSVDLVGEVIGEDSAAVNAIISREQFRGGRGVQDVSDG